MSPLVTLAWVALVVALWVAVTAGVWAMVSGDSERRSAGSGAAPNE